MTWHRKLQKNVLEIRYYISKVSNCTILKIIQLFISLIVFVYLLANYIAPKLLHHNFAAFLRPNGY